MHFYQFFTLGTGICIVGYVRPSADLIGAIEKSFAQHKYSLIYLPTIRKAPGKSEPGGANQSKKYFRRHICFFLQRIGNLVKAFLILPYEKATEYTKPEDFVLSQKTAT